MHWLADLEWLGHRRMGGERLPGRLDNSVGGSIARLPSLPASVLSLGSTNSATVAGFPFVSHRRVEPVVVR